MKTFGFLAIAPFILIGCGDDNGGGNDTTTTNPNDTSDTSNNQCEDNVAPGVSPLTGVNTNVTLTNPNPTNDGCTSAPITNTEGVKYPWGGETVNGRVYTCNMCPFGYPGAQGVWRIHGWTLENGSGCSLQDPDCNENFTEPPAGGNQFIETIWIDGNTFRIRQKNGSDVADIEIKGYYFCGGKPEGPQEHVVWKILEATPNTVDGMQVGDFLESDRLGVTGPGPSTYWYVDLNSENTTDPSKYSTGSYCEYGSSDPYDNVCADPFGDTPCLE